MRQAVELFYIGDWQVSPSTNSVRNGDTVKQLEPKAMDVLIVLCQRQGEVLSADDIVEHCWSNIDVGDNPVHKVITQLRKTFSDKASAPTYIETIRKRGYRIIAELNFPLNDELKAQQSNWQGTSPFPGLSAFEPNEAEVFFGRNEQISALLSRVSKQVKVKRAFCLVLGPSGTGKSSLVNAGVLPKLLQHNGYDGIGVVSYSHLDFADIMQHRLLVDLASSMLDWEVNEQAVFDGMSADKLAQQLNDNCQAVIQQCQISLTQTKTTFGQPHFFLFIDRLEVLLSSPLFSDEERNHFLNLIDTLATSGCIMVFSACRNDFYPLVVSHPSLMAGKDTGGHFDLLAPTRSELMQMIRLPAIAANLTWSNNARSAMSLDELLCNEATNNPDALPMLQYTLQELYLQRNEQNELQESVYLALGGIEGAIGKKAEEVFLQLPLVQQAELDYILSLLITLNPDGETITSRAARWAQLKPISQNALVQAMVDSRLLVSHLQNNQACFSLAHEALLRRWPRASQWIGIHKSSLAIKSRLHILTQRWLDEGKSTAYLLSEGKPLQEALNLQYSGTFVLDGNEQALIKSSVKRAKTKRWSTGVAIVLLCILTFTSVLMSIKSQESQSVAQQKRLEAESLLGFMVGEFADKLRTVQRMDLLDGISNKALEYFSQQDNEAEQSSLLSFINTEKSFKARFQHAQTLSAMGEVAYSRAKQTEAMQAFSSAKLILDKLYLQQPDNLELLKTLGANAFWLGRLTFDQSDFASAQPLFEKYLEYSKRMNQLEPNNVDGWLELFYAHSTMGSLFLKQLNYTEAYNAFTASLRIIERVLKQRPHDVWLRVDKADNLSWLATTEQSLGHLSLALKLHSDGQQELDLGLKNEPNNASILEVLAYSHWHQARLFYYLGQYVKAYNNASQAADILKSILQQDPKNEVWKKNLLSLEIFKVKLVGEKSHLSNAISPTLVEQYIANIFNAPSALPLDFVYLIDYYQANKAWKQSSELIDKASSYLSEYTSTNKNAPEYIRDLAELTLLMAKQFVNSNQLEESRQACKEVIQSLSPLVKVTRNVEYLLPYAQAHSCLNQLDLIPNETAALQNMQVANLNFQP